MLAVHRLVPIPACRPQSVAVEPSLCVDVPRVKNWKTSDVRCNHVESDM